MIGVLDLQGGVVEHLGHLAQLGIRGVRVRSPGDLEHLKGLILPGGESTCLRRLLDRTGLREAIPEAADAGVRLWGTCAGAILLAAEVEGEETCFSRIDIRIRRNGFGSQLDSFTADAELPGVSAEPLHLIFIRAPQILSVGPGVRVLLTVRDTIAAAETPDVLVTTFHPELSPDLAVHRYFLQKCGVDCSDGEAGAPLSTREDTPRHAGTWPYRASDLQAYNTPARSR